MKKIVGLEKRSRKGLEKAANLNKIMHGPFKPKYGTVSQVLLQLVVPKNTK